MGKRSARSKKVYMRSARDLQEPLKDPSESTRFARVMLDMVNKVCNQKDPLIDRSVYMQSDRDPKISTVILENKNGRVREGVVRANEEGPRALRADVRV
jgi:hypothetical protein